MGWFIAAAWIAAGMFFARRAFWGFERWVFKQWPTLYRNKKLESDDYVIGGFIVLFTLIAWPLVVFWWATRPVFSAFFKSPQSRVREAEERQRAIIRQAYDAVIDSAKQSHENPLWMDLARTQLIYAQSLGDPPAEYGYSMRALIEELQR